MALAVDADGEVALGELPGGGADLLDGTDDGADEVHARHHQQQQHAAAHRPHSNSVGMDGTLNLFQRCHHTNGAVIRADIGDVHGNCHHGLAVHLAHPVAAAVLHRLLIVRHGGVLLLGEAGGSEDDTPPGVDRHELHLVLIGEVLNGAAHLGGEIGVGILRIAVEDTGDRGHLGGEVLAGSAVVVVLNGVHKGKVQHQQHQKDQHQIVQDPAACDRPPHCAVLFAFSFTCHSTYIHSPRWW